MQRKHVLGLAGVLVLVSGLDVRADFFVDFYGRPPSPPFGFNNEFLWDDPAVGMASRSVSQ